MHFLALCTLVILVAMASIGCANGSTCLCYCCNTGGSCTPTSAGNTTVSSCSSCTSSLCQSTYNSACVSVNGVTSSSCVSSSSGGGSSNVTSSAHTLFEPTYRTLAMAIVSFPILVYWEIKG
jgi:hypothetical protein